MNVVEIVVTAKNLAKGPLDEATANAQGLGRTVNKMALASGAALVGVGVEAVKMASTFQSEMTRLDTQAGVSKDKLAGLSKGVLELAGQVGESPDSLAESLYHVESNMASMGISSQKALEMVKVAAEGARVGNADLVDVTNALTAAVAANIPGVKDLNGAMGVLNATVGAGDMTMQDLANAFGTGMVATVKGYGLSIRDVGAALATFGDNNIRGAEAGTQLRMTVQALAVPAKTGADALKRLGLSSDTLAKDMQSGGLLKALQDLKTHMTAAGISATEQGQIITEMFGKKAGTGVNILYDQLDRLQSKYPELDKAAGNFSKSWETTKKTTAQQLKDLQGSFDELMITLGDKLLPAVNGVVGAMLKHKDATVGVLGVMAGLMATLVTYSVVVKTIAAVQGIAAAAAKVWAGAQWLLDAALDANPIGLIVIAIGLLVAGFILAYQHSKAFREAIADVGHAFVDVGHWFAKVGVDIWHVIEKIGGFFAKIPGEIGSALSSAGGFLKRTAEAMAHPFVVAFTAVVDWFKKWWPLLLVIFMPVVAVIIHYHKQLESALKATWHAIQAGLVAVWHGIEAAARIAWKAVRAAIVDPAEDVWHRLVAIWNTVAKWLTGIWKDVAAAATSVWRGTIKPAIVEPIIEAWHSVTSTVSKIADALGNGMRSAWNTVSSWAAKFADVGHNIVMGIVNGVEHAAGALYNSLSRLASNALQAAKSYLGIASPSKLFADEIGQQIPAGIAAGVQGNDAAHRAVGALATSLVRGAANVVRSVGSGSLGGHMGGLAVASLPAGGSAAAMGGGAGGVVTVQFNFAGADQEFLKFIRKTVRVTGRGDVQLAFGK